MEETHSRTKPTIPAMDPGLRCLESLHGGSLPDLRRAEGSGFPAFSPLAAEPPSSVTPQRPHPAAQPTSCCGSRPCRLLPIGTPWPLQAPEDQDHCANRPLLMPAPPLLVPIPVSPAQAMFPKVFPIRLYLRAGFLRTQWLKPPVLEMRRKFFFFF